MAKIKAIFILGILVFAIPFLGFPEDWKKFFYALAGITISLVAVLLRGAVIQRGERAGEKTADSFLESGKFTASSRVPKFKDEIIPRT